MERMRMGPIGEKTIFQTEWNETDRNVISHIIVSYDKTGVRSIQFGFVDNGALVMSKTYGSLRNGCKGNIRIVRLKQESEFVTGISGEIYCGYITSLTFHTNQQIHEAVHLTFDSGKTSPEKKEFVSGMLERSEFGGFFGSSGYSRLTSIGFYVRFVLPDVKPIQKDNI